MEKDKNNEEKISKQDSVVGGNLLAGSDLNLVDSFKVFITKLINFVKSTLSFADEVDKEATVKMIKNQIQFKGFNIWILIFSIIIASIGLNTNSTAVIIGAMLISPLMGPIMGIGLSMGTNDWSTLIKSFRALIITVAVSLVTSTLYFLITPFGEVLLYNYIEGQTWREDVNIVSDILSRIRVHKCPKGLRKLSSLPSDIKKNSLEIISTLNSYHKNKLMMICPEVSISDVEPVLIHTDVVPGNLILGNKGLRLIDWQCPAIGDPILDVVMFLSPGMHEIYGSGKLSMNDHETFLMHLTSKLRSRYNILGPLYHWRLAAYCFWKAEQGFIEYENAALEEINLIKMI